METVHVPLLVLDPRMPRMAGFEALAAVRTLGRYRSQIVELPDSPSGS